MLKVGSTNALFFRMNTTCNNLLRELRVCSSFLFILFFFKLVFFKIVCMEKVIICFT